MTLFPYTVASQRVHPRVSAEKEIKLESFRYYERRNARTRTCLGCKTESRDAWKFETRGNFVRFRLGEILNDKPRGRSEFPRIHLG